MSIPMLLLMMYCLMTYLVIGFAFALCAMIIFSVSLLEDITGNPDALWSGGKAIISFALIWLISPIIFPIWIYGMLRGYK